MSTLYLIGFVQTIFLAILIITKKKLKLSDLFLILFILIMGCRLLFIHFSELGLYASYPQLVLMEFIYWPLFGPLLYLYISTITSQNQKFKLIYLINFLPALIVFFAFFGYILESGYLYFNEYNQRGILFQVGLYVWFYTTHAYFILCIIKLYRYRRKIKNYFSYKKNIDLKWLMILTYGFGVFLFYSLIYIMTKSYFDFEMPEFVDHLTWLIMVVYIFGIGFFGYKQKGVFNNSENISMMNDNILTKTDTDQLENKYRDIKDAGQYLKSKINETENNKILEALLKNMEEEKPYLNCELDIRMLAEKLNTTPHKLSQVVNTNLNKNFYEFINEYRIRDAKFYLTSPQCDNEKIMTIAYDCGFNSKSSFYSVFKKFTSQTPAKYKSKHLEN